MNYSEKMTNRLNELITKNYDSEAGYKLAQEKVKNHALKNFFELRMKERYDFGHQIKKEMKSFGGEVDKGTSIAGDLHRGWINFKTAFSSDNDEAILEEAVRGEKAAIEEYQEVLKETDMPPTTENVLTMQLTAIKAALKDLENLEMSAYKYQNTV